MAFKKTLAQRLLSITKISSQSHSNCRISYSSVQSRIPPSVGTSDIAPDPGQSGAGRRFVHNKSVKLPELRKTTPSTGNLLRQLRDMDNARKRVRFDGLTPPESSDEVSVEDARKFRRAVQIETVKSKLRKIQQSCITYSEFIRICGENCDDEDQAMNVAKMLDDSAVIIIVGDIVFVRPEQVAKSIQALLLPVPVVKANESVRKELEVMEKEKAAIDNKADTLVRRELWGGLGFMVLQTAALMRLTFWELSWDVMEPICYYLTSIYFMGGYTFFLRTSKEPSFEAFYQSRFSTKQKYQMKLHNFDVSRYNKLRAASTFSNPLNKFPKNL